MHLPSRTVDVAEEETRGPFLLLGEVLNGHFGISTGARFAGVVQNKVGLWDGSATTHRKITGKVPYRANALAYPPSAPCCTEGN